MRGGIQQCRPELVRVGDIDPGGAGYHRHPADHLDQLVKRSSSLASGRRAACAGRVEISGSVCRTHPGSDPVVIGSLRAAESAVAPDLLGVRDADVIRLRLPDTAVAAHEAELAGLLRGLCAGFAVCLAPWDGDAHADHEATGRAARRAARTVLSYPIRMWHWARPAGPRVPWSRACRIPLPADSAARKRSAIGAFASQLTGRGALGPVLPPPDGRAPGALRPRARGPEPGPGPRSARCRPTSSGRFSMARISGQAPARAGLCSSMNGP